MNLETKITIYKFTPQLFTLTPLEDVFVCKYMTFFQYYKQFTEKNSTTGNILSYIQPFDPINY